MVTRGYPDAVQLGDVTKVSRDTLKQATAGFCHLRHILILAGPPCQDLSGANAQRQGLSGKRSCLFWEAVRVAREVVPEAFPDCTVSLCLENVSSMKNEDRDTMSRALGTFPVLGDPVGLWPVKRPRYFWMDWDLPPSNDYLLEDKSGYTKMSLTGP